METEIIVIILVIVMFVVLIYLFAKLLNVIQNGTLRRQEQRIPKFNDKKLMRGYRSLNHQRKNKFLAIYLTGFYYKSTLAMYEKQFQLYQAEVERRGLDAS
ncbi:hypothetical protein SAMN04488134_103122 [Amphibacillus marinus]|uniref:Uncharacterized protein n=1 Tax=Amphibacillus marinus TaxID=872970 RepID=A0A1H8L8L6_9BACI|nr:hypothetical protein [Amphibacillus marinus]SEO01457.1 hypothetical protein SAMN04488134_103122 [Amphibacillus marinus]